MRRRAKVHRTTVAALSLAVLVAAGGGGVRAQGQLPLPSPPTPAATAGWVDDAVCYEVFVRSFADSDGDGVGDLRGLTDRLDYINDGDPATRTDLGATCLWLMPIFESPSYHGYDTVDHYAVDREYGSNEDFVALVDAAHARGVRVLLDLMLNHTSSEHPWFREALADPASPYRDWYRFSTEDPGYRGPWGQKVWHPSPVGGEYFYGVFYEGMPDLNYRNPAVTAEAERISRFWLEEMGADGFRLDAIKHLIEDDRVQENTPETQRWLREYRAFLGRVAPDAFTVGEVFGGGTGVLASYYPDGLDSFFAFEVGQTLLAAANYGLAADFVDAAEGAYTKLPDQRWAPFLTNHDQPRTMTELGDVAEARLAATALLTLPGLPFVYYGEEIGMGGDKPDELIRTPMQWAPGPGGGFTEGRPWEPFQPDLDTVNVAAQDADPASLLNRYRALVALHAEVPALGHGDFAVLETGSAGVAAYVRRAGDSVVLVVLNFGKAPATGVALGGVTSLAAGAYGATPLLDHAAGAPLTVADGGTIGGYVALPSLEPKSGYVFALAS